MYIFINIYIYYIYIYIYRAAGKGRQEDASPTPHPPVSWRKFTFHVKSEKTKFFIFLHMRLEFIS